MASPQLENGHTRIANAIIEALARTNLSGAEMRFVLFLIRLTYGWQRKQVATNVTAFATKLKSTDGYMIEVIDNLIKKKVITCEWATEKVCNLALNKDFDTWRCFL